MKKSGSKSVVLNKQQKNKLIISFEWKSSNVKYGHKMNKNLENVCRVCLGTGSRNIFEKSPTSNDSQFSIPAIAENVSSLDRLPEKLRYVTMLKVSNNESHFNLFFVLALSFRLSFVVVCSIWSCSCLWLPSVVDIFVVVFKAIWKEKNVLGKKM